MSTTQIFIRALTFTVFISVALITGGLAFHFFVGSNPDWTAWVIISFAALFTASSILFTTFSGVKS